ncbi:MAG: hypothetical protein AB1508_10215 [Pseudomonadota bacterium]
MRASKTTNLASEKIGRRGERKFDDLCELAGLTVSMLHPDMTGRDRHVEFPLAALDGPFTYDTRLPPLACYVQIKTLLAKNDKFELRLSIAERLARESKPAFIAVLRLNEDNEFVDMHLVHISRDVLTAILKRLRKEHARKEEHLNRKTISFSVKDGEKVDLVPVALRQAFESAIGKDMAEYATAKHKYLKEVGYDAHRYKLRVKFAPIKIEELVDGFLGRSELKITNLETFERRFGIALPAGPQSTLQPKFHTLRIEPHPADRCRVTAMNSKTGETASIVGDLYRVEIPGLETKYRRATIKTDLLEFEFSNEGLSFQFGDDEAEDKRYSLDLMKQSCRILHLCTEDSCVVSFRYEKSGIETKTPLSFDSVPKDLAWVRSILTLLDAADGLRHLAREDDFSVCLNDLILQEREIVEAHNFMTGNSSNSAILFETDLFPEEVKVEKSTFLFTSPVSIGDRFYGYALRGLFVPQMQGGSIKWISEELVSLTIEPLRGDFQEAYDAFVKKISQISRVPYLLRRSLGSVK